MHGLLCRHVYFSSILAEYLIRIEIAYLLRVLVCVCACVRARVCVCARSCVLACGLNTSNPRVENFSLMSDNGLTMGQPPEIL